LLYPFYFDFNDNSISIIECCSVFVRDEEDRIIEELYKDDERFLRNGKLLWIMREEHKQWSPPKPLD
jgi:hypothetical protein